MGIKATIVAGDGRLAKFTPLGQLETAPGDFDLPKFQSLAVINTAYNFYTPIPGRQFIVTGVLAFATKDVANNTDTSIVIYEAIAPDTATAKRVILQFGMGQLTVLPVSGIRLLVSEGVYINAKVDDAVVDLNLFGHFVSTITKDVSAAAGVA